jgi:NitT/TauT family transport system ATP-binding protein
LIDFGQSSVEGSLALFALLRPSLGGFAWHHPGKDLAMTGATVRPICRRLAGADSACVITGAELSVSELSGLWGMRRMNVSAVAVAGPSSLAIPRARPFVELSDVSLSFGGRDHLLALDRVSFEVGGGEFVAVVGPSGCGKSTLMKLVTGLLPPNSGTVSVDGSIVTAPIKCVGMAFQNSTLMPWRDTLHNVMLPLEIVKPFKRERRRHHAEHKARAERLLQAVGLGGFGAKYPWQLSGGMQQRANLCRALVHEPKLLVLDEPFAALDAFTREELWVIMQDLWIRRKFSSILVTHDLREAVFLADNVYVLSKRPGSVIYRRRIELPRPRTIADSFEPYFVNIVHELRDKIMEARA